MIYKTDKKKHNQILQIVHKTTPIIRARLLEKKLIYLQTAIDPNRLTT